MKAIRKCVDQGLLVPAERGRDVLYDWLEKSAQLPNLHAQWGWVGSDAQSDWRNSRCRLSSLTDCRTVTRILSSHSEALRATSLWEGKERVDGSFQVSPSTGSAAKILRSEKVPSFSRTYSLCHRYIHIHIYVIVFRFHGDLYTWQAEHRRGSKARERRACSTREEIYFVYLIVWIGWFRESDSRPCWSPRTLERIETGVLPM